LNLDQWDQSIGDLYQSILQPSLLAPAVTAANRMMDSDFCHLFGLTSTGEQTFLVMSDSSHAEAVQKYSERYWEIDPRRSFVDTLPPGLTYRCSSICDAAFVARDAFYQDYLIPHGLRYLIGSCLHRSAQQSVYVGFNHGAGRADFSDEEASRFSMLGAHLQRTVDASINAASAAQALAASEHAVDALQYGVVGVHRLQGVAFANRYAERYVLGRTRAGFAGGRLVDGGVLQALFLAVLADGRAHAGRVDSALLEQPLQVMALPLAARGSNLAALDAALRTEVVLIFSLGKQRKMASPSQLMQWFPLTPAEARLAHELGCGLSIDEFAVKYCVSVATARTQLRAVLRKTGEDRQQQLVRMLVTLPALSHAY
jgi:DNA-binding CsgD family transcriptional regulator